VGSALDIVVSASYYLGTACRSIHDQKQEEISMASKADFTPEEWKTIVAAAPMVGLAVTCASPNGPWGVMKEMLSMGMAMAEILQKGSSNPLIAELAADLKARQTKTEPPQGLKDPEQCTQSALNHVRAVNDLLNRKVKPEEADEFKKWLLAVGRRVAEASNEGGIFGFGGEQVSEAETNVLRQIAFALEQPAT
jgi:hypothetical protein